MNSITAIGKTTIQNITTKITTTALLFFLALFTLTTNLKAQAVQNSKSGFFAGFVYLQGFQVNSTKSITTSPTTSYRVTYYDETTRIDATGGTTTLSDAEKTGIKTLISANCERDATSINNSDGKYSLASGVFQSFDPGPKPTAEQIANGDATVTMISEANPFPNGEIEGQTSHCFTYFSSSARTDFVFSDYPIPDGSTDFVEPQVSTESDKLSGIGLQFGYRWEKWRASFTHYTGQGGDNELTNSLVIADYFFQEKFFVGAGLASIKLTNSSAEGDSISASATSPVLQVGYAENLTKNLQLSIGVLQYSSGLSLSSTTPTTTPTITPFGSVTQTATNEGDSATIGVQINLPNGNSVNTYLGTTIDWRVEVIQVGERTVNIEEIVTPAGGGTIEAELKAPTVISISLHYSF